MGNFTKFFLLLISIFWLSHSVPAAYSSPGDPGCSSFTANQSSNLNTLTAASATNFVIPGYHCSNDQFQEKKIAGITARIGKYKKKYKRTVPVFSSIKTPIKEVDIVTSYIFYTESYIKRHFLSHLHLFLFRLTPF